MCLTWVLGEESLYEVPGLLGVEAEDHENLVDVARVHADRVVHLGRDVLEAEVVVRDLGRARDLTGAGEAEVQEVDHEAVVLEDEAGELEAADQTVRVRVHHVLEGDDHVVLGRHVVGDVVVHDQPQKPVEQGEVDLLVDLRELGLHHDHALALVRVPDLLEVVHALAPLVDQQRRRLGVGRLAPVREQVALVRLIPEVLRVA